MIANAMSSLTQNFATNIIQPSLDPVVKKLFGGKESLVVDVGGIKIKLGAFIAEFINFLTLALILYFLMSFGMKISRPAMNTFVQNWPKGGV